MYADEGAEGIPGMKSCSLSPELTSHIRSVRCCTRTRKTTVASLSYSLLASSSLTHFCK